LYPLILLLTEVTINREEFDHVLDTRQSFI
jgi:hypothetical protein